MQGHADGAVADHLDRAVGHAHGSLAHLVAGLAQLFGDVVVGDGAEQAAVHAGLLGQLERGAGQLLAQSLGFGQLGGGGLLELGAAGFEVLLGLFGGATGAARGDQEVAGVTVLDLDDFAEVAEVHDLVEQNHLHGRSP